MNRDLTNLIRYFLDEWLPPAIRDNKFFMWPLYVMAFKKLDVKTEMNFKNLAPHMSEDEFASFYKNRNTISSERATDLNAKCLQQIQDHFKGKSGKVLDVGCGKGYLCQKISEISNTLSVTGVDIAPPNNPHYVSGFAENLPFEDSSFDYVLCTHTLEHVRNLPKAISELLRVARKELIVVVPKQRPYFYTLDEHLHFFFHKGQLESLFKPLDCEIQCLNGDWFVCVSTNPASGAL